MEVKITYDDIITRCEQLSAFEARGKVDAQGQSRFLDIHIGEVDTILIKQYITQARALLEERFERMILDTSEENKEETVITVLPDTREVLPFDGFVDLDEFKYENESSGMPDGAPVGVLRRGSSQRNRDEFIQYLYTGDGVDQVLEWVYYSDARYYSQKYVFRDSTDGKKYEWDSDRTNIIAYTQPTKTDTVTEPYAFTWLIRTDTRWNGISTFTKHVNEAITSYVMAQWLSGRLDERVAFYDNLFNTSLTMAAKNIFTKTAP